MNRRNFLGAMLAACAAPAIVRAASLMPVRYVAQGDAGLLIPMEIGIFESFRFIESPPIDITARLDDYRKEMLDRAQQFITLEATGLAMNFPYESGKTIKFRRYPP